MMNRPTEYLLVAAIALSGAYVYAWLNRQAEIPTGITVEATPAQEVKNETPTETIKPPVVKVHRAAVKGKLNLPANITNDDNQHVLTSIQAPNDERPHTITTVIDQQTGAVQTFDRADPLPWMVVKTKTELGVFYGMKSGEPTVRIEGRQELLQIKAVHVGAIASADMTKSMGTETFAGVGVWARF